MPCLLKLITKIKPKWKPESLQISSFFLQQLHSKYLKLSYINLKSGKKHTVIYINLSYNNQPKNDIESKTLKLEFDLLEFVIEKVNNVMGDASNYNPCPKTYKRTQRNTST